VGEGVVTGVEVPVGLGEAETVVDRAGLGCLLR
jgi:hypothetical protein